MRETDTRILLRCSDSFGHGLTYVLEIPKFTTKLAICQISYAPHDAMHLLTWMIWTGLIPSLRSANERRRYFVTTSLIDWVQAQNQPCVEMNQVNICSVSAQIGKSLSLHNLFSYISWFIYIHAWQSTDTLADKTECNDNMTGKCTCGPPHKGPIMRSLCLLL